MPSALGSRNGQTDPGGKLTEQVTLQLSEDLLEGLTALAVLAGVPRGEYMRRVLRRHTFGELPLVRELCGRDGASATVGNHRESNG